MSKFHAAAAAIASLGLGVAVPAFAQDQGPESGKAPFTGARVEALVGYDHLSSGGAQGEGVTYGGAVGYDLQLGGVVVGAEGEIAGSSTKLSDHNVLTAGDSLRIGAGRDLYIGGRVGFVASPRTLIYAKAGYTNARVSARYTVGTGTIEDHSDLNGYRVGGGVEYNVTHNAYMKLEYRYSHYSNVEGYDIDANRHQVLAGVGFRF